MGSIFLPLPETYQQGTDFNQFAWLPGCHEVKAHIWKDRVVNAFLLLRLLLLVTNLQNMPEHDWYEYYDRK